MRVRLENISYPCFFSLSLALHLALVPLLWRKPFSAAPMMERISVSFFEDARRVEPRQKRSAPPPRTSRRPAQARAKQIKRAANVEKKPAPPQSEVVEAPRPTAPAPPDDPKPLLTEPPAPINQASSTSAPAQSEASIFKEERREKPITKSDLLPGRREIIANHRAIPLNTSDVRYAPYTQTVKQWIEARWEYPDLAKHYGLQGRVVVEFTILKDGHIELLALVRSSGSKLLDEEAVRAIKAAVPFKPFPRSIRESSLRIIAGFIYSDQRLRMTDSQ
jgi:protein TonB